MKMKRVQNPRKLASAFGERHKTETRGPTHKTPNRNPAETPTVKLLGGASTTQRPGHFGFRAVACWRYQDLEDVEIHVDT